MDAAQIEQKVAAAIITASEQCERGVIGHREIAGRPIGAYVIMAPNCIVYCQPLIPEADIFIDFCLN